MTDTITTRIQSVFRKPEHNIEIIDIDDDVAFVSGSFIMRGVLVDIRDDGWGRIQYHQNDMVMFTWLTANFVSKLKGTRAEIDALPMCVRFKTDPCEKKVG